MGKSVNRCGLGGKGHSISEGDLELKNSEMTRSILAEVTTPQALSSPYIIPKGPASTQAHIHLGKVSHLQPKAFVPPIGARGL